MREKGQGLVFFISVVVVVLISGLVGFYLGRGIQFFLPKGKIEIIEEQDPELSREYTSVSTINNCAGSSSITFEDQRKVAVLTSITIDDSINFGAGIRNAILGEIEKKYSIVNNSVKEVSRTVEIGVKPKEKVEVMYTWQFQYQEGVARVGGKEYKYKALIDAQITYKPNPIPCR